MRIVQAFINIVLLITTPLLLLLPHDSLSALHIDSRFPPKPKIPHIKSLLTYDDVIALLDDLESGKLEKNCSEWQRRDIDQLLIRMASEGTLPGDMQGYLTLQEDITNLLSEESFYYDYACNDDEEANIVPAIFKGKSEFTLCKSKKKSNWHKTKSFFKKHKKAIIIGAAIVVATTVIVVATVATSGGCLAVVGGVAGAAASSHDDKKENKQETEPPPLSVQDKITFEDNGKTPALKAVINENTSIFKEFMAEDIRLQNCNAKGWNDLSFSEKTRELGAYLAHQTFEEVSELVSFVPQLCQELKEVGSQLKPENFSNNADLITSPKKNYENLLTSGHQTIDKVFSSDQAQLYSAEGKANDPMNDFAVGIVLLPGSLSKIFSNTKKLEEAGRVLDRAGFTKAGRNLMKHGYRENSIFPKPTGNADKVNEHGQKILEKILNHPEREVTHKHSKLLGEVVDIHAPGIGGVRYNTSGEFIGFLESP